MAKPPRKSDLGFKHDVSPPAEGMTFWTVAGPATGSELVYVADKEVAEVVAAALNFAHNFPAVQREARRLADQLQIFEDFK